MFRSKKNKSVVSLLHNRELNNKCAPYFLSASVVSQLIRANSNSLYKECWKKSCIKSISYDTGYLYFYDYTGYSSLFGRNYEPSPIQKMEESVAKRKISDVVSYSIPVYKTVDDICQCSANQCTCLSQYLLSISEDNWLCQHLMVSGKLVRQLYANRTGYTFRFKYCDWDVYGERFVLTSILNPESSTCSKKSAVVVNLAIFTVFPFEFLTLLEIKRSVFGDNCTAASISDQHLIVGLGTTQVHIYSFEDFLNEGKLTPYKLGDKYGDDGKIGCYPTGIPLNFTYEKGPPLLFNVQCMGQIARFGGYPYHYVIKRPGKHRDFVIKNIENSTLAVEDMTQSCVFNGDMDAVLFFHPDHSNRLIWKSDSTVDCYKLSNSNGVSKISKSFSMGFFVKEPEKRSMSSYGRPTTQRTKHSCPCTIFSTDYASDLDIFAILGIYPIDITAGFVKLYDSVTGEEIRTIELNDKFCDDSAYELYVDMGTIIIIETKLPSGCVVYVYNL